MSRYGYERVSTNDQHPEAQGDKLRAAGCNPIFTDKGVSGSRARRPKWDKLLAALQPGDQVVCVRLDRIGRSVANLLEIVRHLDEAGVELIVLDQNIDTSTPTGRLLFTVLAAIAEFERGLIIERTLDGQASVRRTGNLRRSLGGNPPLGFRLGDPETDDDWVLDPIAADWLADAAERVLNGDEIEAVFGILPEIADSTGRKVTAKMLRAALQRPASAGLMSDGEPAAIDGPLDEPTFRRLEILFGSRKRGRPVGTGRFPFSRVLRCGKCGNQLTGSRGWKGRDYYGCKTPHKALGITEPCRGVSVAAEDVHLLIRERVMQWAASPEARLAAARTPETAGRRAELETRIAEAQGWLADLAQKRQRRYITPARFAELEAETIKQIDADAAELDELERVDAQPGVPVIIEWDTMTAAEQMNILTVAFATPIAVEPGNGGGAALTAYDRIKLLPAPSLPG